MLPYQTIKMFFFVFNNNYREHNEMSLDVKIGKIMVKKYISQSLMLHG